ncbi:MAG: HAD family hydrolase [Thermoplasmata archaeon]
MSSEKPLHIFFDAEGTLYHPRNGKTSRDFWSNGERTVKRAKEYFELDPEVPALLRALRNRGHRLHILSRNVKDVLRPLVSHFNIGPYFDSVAIEDNKAKYLVEFKHREGLEKEHIVMIGDTWSLDVRPVQRQGIRAILLDREGKSTVANRIGDLGDVLRLSEDALESQPPLETVCR